MLFFQKKKWARSKAIFTHREIQIKSTSLKASQNFGQNKKNFVEIQKLSKGTWNFPWFLAVVLDFIFPLIF